MKKSIRITTLTTIGTLLLLLLTIVLRVSQLWGMQEIRKPYDLLHRQSEIIEQVQVGLRKQIDEYLQTGNAVLLNEAENSLKQLSEQHLNQAEQEIADALGI